MLAKNILIIIVTLLSTGIPFSSFGAPSLNSEQRRLLDIYVRPFENFPTQVRWTTLQKSASPLSLRNTPVSGLKYNYQGREYSLDEYFQRQPVTALLVYKNGNIVFEKYQYSGSATALYYSASIAKSLVGIAVTHLEESGKIKSQEDALGEYVTELRGTPLGEASIRNHMRMGSGVKYSENHNDSGVYDDHSRFIQTVESQGLKTAFKAITSQEVVQGSRFSYIGVSSGALSTLVKSTTGKNTAQYFSDEVWSRIGTEGRAYWIEDSDGETWGYCCFLGRARDYLRLGIVLANGGRRPDTNEQIISPKLFSRISNLNNVEPPFKPPAIKGVLAYDSQFWLSTRVPESFALVGLYGQILVVHPRSSLVIVHFGMSGSRSDVNPLNDERNAMLGGLFFALK